jgi:ABC-2 type transport system ATP-binding protein
MSTAVEIRHLGFSYGKNKILHDLNLTVRSGSFYALLGRNGIGKTTLLKILTGLLEPQIGTAYVLQKETRHFQPADWLSIGYMSENQQIYDWLTGEQLIAFTRPLYPAWDQSFCDYLTRQMQLPLRLKVRRYSKGQRMKLLLLLAIAYHPRLLLLDEPFSGLDVLAKEQLIACLLETTQQEQWAVLFTSHDLAEAERLADDIGLMENGQLQINESLQSLQNRFRRIQAYGLTSVPNPDPSMWQGQAQEDDFTFIETAFSESRRLELQSRFGPTMEITPLALREIVLAFLIEASAENAS